MTELPYSVLDQHMMNNRHSFTRIWTALTMALVVIVILAGMVGYLGYRVNRLPNVATKNSGTLGICVDNDWERGSISVGSPIVVDGVVSCQAGSFTPVVPVDVEAAGGA